MRARLLEAALFLLAAAAGWYGFGPPRAVFGYHPPPRPAGGLRLVSWNIGVAGDADPGARAAEIERVRATLLELDADVVVLQEVEPAELESLAGDFADVRTAFAGGDGRGCAVLVQRGRLVHLDRDAQGARTPVHVVYRPREGPGLELIGMHADPWSAAARNRQIGEAVERLAASGSLPLAVLAGDLNLDVDLGGGRDLFTEDEYLDVQTYNYVAQTMLDAARNAGATAEPDRRLDYVFVRSEAVEVLDSGVWRGRRIGGMDHHPVVVDLR